MKQEQINQGNELIAKYVGAKYQGSYPNGDAEESHLYHYGDNAIVPLNFCRTHSHTTMQYHKSWDWLVPVYNKLMQDDVEVSEMADLPWEIQGGDIENLFIAIVKVIKSLDKSK